MAQMFNRRPPEDEAFDELMGGQGVDPNQYSFSAASRNRAQVPGMQGPRENPYGNFDRGSRIPQMPQMPQSQGGLDQQPMQQPMRSGGIGMPSSQMSVPSAGGYTGGNTGITGGVQGGAASQLQMQPSRGANAPPSALGQYSGSLEGFDAGKLQSGHDSPKYQVARVLSKYPPTPEGLQQALPELQALGLADSVNLIGNDKLQFGGAIDPRFEGMNTFDVLRGADAGGMGWQWGAEGGGDPMAGGGGAQMGGQMGGGDPFAQLGVLQQQAAAGDSYSAQVLQMLMQELGLNQALGR